MRRSDLASVVYDTLKIPQDVKESMLITYGEIIPSDNMNVVEALTNTRIRAIEKAKAKAFEVGLDDHRAALEKRSYHTFQDFCLLSRHEEPTRKDIKDRGVRYGHSTVRPSSDEAYLAYVQDKDPELAEFFFTKLAARFAERDRLRHTLILGKSGYGKSKLLKQFIYQYYHQKKGYSTTVLIDPHGDLAQEIAQLKEFRNSDDLVFIEPYADKKNNYFPVLNVFDTNESTMQELDSRAQSVNNAFRSIIGTEFTDSMRALLPPCYWVLFLRPNSTLKDLILFMDDSRNQELVKFGMEKLPYKEHRDFFRYEFASQDNKRTKAALAKKFRILMNSPNFYDCLCKTPKTSYNIQGLLDSKKVVVFSLPLGRLGDHISSVIGSFLVP